MWSQNWGRGAGIKKSECGIRNQTISSRGNAALEPNEKLEKGIAESAR